MDELAAEQTPPKIKTLKGRAAAAVTSLRWWCVLPIPLAILALNAWGPDGWSEPFVWAVWTSKALILIAVGHASRRILASRLDLSLLIEKAQKGDLAASILGSAALIFMALIFIGLVNYAKAEPINAETYIPTNARPLLPVLKQTQLELMPGFEYPSYFGALIEQESCISLTHSRCWNSRAQLKTSREEGAGLGQFTRAWRADGSLRFDALTEVRGLDPVGLRDFNWSTVYARADLSLRAIVVKVKDCHLKMQQQSQAESFDRMAFCDAAYNGGYGGMLQDRRLCALKRGCQANRWFGEVENTSEKSRTAWQGYGKSAFAINREHVFNTVLLRRPKYAEALGFDL